MKTTKKYNCDKNRRIKLKVDAKSSKRTKIDDKMKTQEKNYKQLLVEYTNHLRREKLLHLHDVTVEGEVEYFLCNRNKKQEKSE